MLYMRLVMCLQHAEVVLNYFISPLIFTAAAYPPDHEPSDPGLTKPPPPSYAAATTYPTAPPPSDLSTLTAT